MRDLTAEEWSEVRAAVALPGWRWMPGMLSVPPVIPEDGERPWPPQRVRPHYRGHMCVGLCTDGRPEDNPGCLPDPRDPAAAGCLLALLGGAGHRWDRWPGELTAEHREEDGFVTSGAVGDFLGLAVIRCALDRGRWGDGS